MKGVRTIALRLTGTKEAAEELEEMGEDTSDMIVSQSKMRELIMNATKVASNNYKGFDIQDELGRYKSTYEIMLGLSQIWDEIRQADLKTGDNRQNLLLESIAGKNRASIASSILQNPDVLQSVYEDSSTKSAGSALEENQKYLDSISGQIGYILQKCNTQIIHLIAGTPLEIYILQCIVIMCECFNKYKYWAISSEAQY